MKSKYKHLVVSGCSFTANNHDSSCCWANVLAERMGASILNLAVDAAGNTHIANSIILYLEQHALDPETTLVLPMWSSVGRTDFIVGNHYTLKPTPVRKYQYDLFSQLYSICEAKEKTYYGPWAAAYKQMQTHQSLSLQSWLEITKLTNYLHQHSYDFKYLTFADILHGQGLVEIDFLSCLRDLSLQLPAQADWLLTDPGESLGEFALYHDWVCEDGIHPNLTAHETWLEQKLIPALINTNILSQ